MKRQDQLLAHMDAYAVDRATNALLLKYIGTSADAKIVKSKLQAIDPITKALLVKFVGTLPVDLTGEQIVVMLEALSAGSRLSHNALDDIHASNHHARYTNPEAVTAVEGADPLNLQDNVIKDNHIDFGTGANQVSGADMPIADADAHFATDNVEAALQEVAADRENMMALIYLGL